MQKSSKAQSSNNWGCTFRKVAFYAVPLFFAVCVFVAARPFYSVEAQRELGDKYRNAGDNTLALYWYRKAAANGDVEKQKKLGLIYYYGEGVSQDYAEAVKWYRKAAEQGHAEAQYHLGDMYEKG